LARPEDVEARIVQGQDLIRRHFTSDAVAQRWSAVLGAFSVSAPRHDQVRP